MPTQPDTPLESLPLAGRKVYLASVIAAYTVLANISVGCVLYGMNLQARGSKLGGWILIACGVLSGIFLLLTSTVRHMPVVWIFFLSVLAAFFFYWFEKEPVKAAIKNGATPARWWPPALIVAAIMILFAGVAHFIP